MDRHYLPSGDGEARGHKSGGSTRPSDLDMAKAGVRVPKCVRDALLSRAAYDRAYEGQTVCFRAFKASFPHLLA